MKLNKITSFIVSSALISSIMTAPGADSVTTVSVRKADTIFAADIITTTSNTTSSEMTTSFSTTTTTNNTTATTTTTTTTELMVSTYAPVYHNFSKVISYPTKTEYAQGENLSFKGLECEFKNENSDNGYYQMPTYCTIFDKDTNSVPGTQFSTLPAGEYTVKFDEDITYRSHPMHYYNGMDISYKVTIREATEEELKEREKQIEEEKEKEKEEENDPNPPYGFVWGDANLDGDVDMADAVLIMQSLANPNLYGISGTSNKHIRKNGLIRGDVDKSIIGLTSNDALLIQQYLLKQIATLGTDIPPVITTTAFYSTTTTTPVNTKSTSNSTTTTLVPLTTPITTVSKPDDFYFDYVVTGGSGMAQSYYTFKGVESYPTTTVFTEGSSIDFSGLKFRVADNKGEEKTLGLDFLSGLSSEHKCILDKDGFISSLNSPGEYTVVYSRTLTKWDDKTYTVIRDVDIAFKVTILPKSDNYISYDANHDGEIDIGDTVFMMQNTANPNVY